MSPQAKRSRSNKAVFTGLIIMALGVVWLLRKMGFYLPGWLFGWEMILIVIGVAVGINNRFRNPVSWILIAIGGFSLLDEVFYIPFTIREYLWPLAVIAIGLLIIVRPKRKHSDYFEGRVISGKENEPNAPQASSDSHTSNKRRDKLDMVSIFNGIKRNVFSKNWMGGESVTVFGGSELNLVQADFDKIVELECVVIFGGLKLIVPRNWEVRTEVTSIFGGVEDKRYSAVEVVPEDKVLVLTGAVVFGGIDIVSY